MLQTTSKRAAKVMLFSAALIWGSTFVFIKKKENQPDMEG